MKKILLFVLLLAVLCFTACDDKGNDANTELGAGANTDMTPVGAVDETVEEPVEEPMGFQAYYNEPASLEEMQVSGLPELRDLALDTDPDEDDTL